MDSWSILEFKNYKTQKQKQIDEILNQNLNYKNELENKIKILEKEYNSSILINTNKINKKQKLIELINEVINSEESDIIEENNNTSSISENILFVPDLITPELQKKTNKNRPETIKGCFNTNTIIRHKKKGFQEFCIYIVSEGCLFRCDQNGIYDKNSIRYSKLNQFTSENYKKNLPNRTERNNAYTETEYLCKISNKFLSLSDLKKDTIYN